MRASAALHVVRRETQGFDIQERRALSADSGAFRSGRVPDLKESAGVRRILTQPRLLMAGQTPAHYGGLNLAARLVVSPFTVHPAALERQLIGAAVVLAEHLHRQVCRRLAIAIEFSQ